jgi:DNA excision repair protein ERCC-2
MKTISLGVHDFVDLILRRGDLDNRIFNTLSMEEGTRLHAWYQNKQGPEYASEVYLEHTFVKDDFTLQMSGRADGIITHGPDDITIDEIKTTNTDIEEFYKAQKDWHLGQALVYAYIYLLDHSLNFIKVQLTYISQLDTTQVKQYLFIYQQEDLRLLIDVYLDLYVDFLKKISLMKDERQTSIQAMQFPFPSLRKGQKELMDFVKGTVETGQVGFCEAKTGIGKTVSCLYPYIQALGEKNLEKIFYLTSKNSIKAIVYETLKRMDQMGVKLKAVFMTSKERICLNSKKRHCNPDECIYAKNYYDKVNRAIFDGLGRKDLFQEQDVLELAEEYQICPFELQLDLLNYADIIVGDYNYLFDPTARLIRFFETYQPNPYLLLVDEAHNLPDRVRDMFSSEIRAEDLHTVLDSLKKEKGKGIKPLKEDLARLITYFAQVVLTQSESSYAEVMEEASVPDQLIDLLNGFVGHGKKYMKDRKSINDEFLSFYYLAQQFLSLPPSDKKFAYYFTFAADEKTCLSFSIGCLDPRPLIKAGYLAFQAGVCFSATLSPKKYFIDLLGGNDDSETLYLPSPFDPSNCLVMVDPFISTKFRDREYSVGKITDAILAVVKKKVGNYFIFFPSFEYMMKFKPFFDSMSEFRCFYQSSQMDEGERENFLSQFQRAPSKTTLGFIVLGGIFAEGIDLTDDRLIGAIIVSVGLPKINYLSDRIQQYFGEDSPDLGYAYAYTYPGLNRVFQAAGRVIRGEKDKGVILYIDTRFDYTVYKSNLSEMYQSYLKLGTPELIGAAVIRFWEKKDK